LAGIISAILAPHMAHGSVPGSVAFDGAGHPASAHSKWLAFIDASLAFATSL